MLDKARVDEIARRVAIETLGVDRVINATSSSTTDSTGRDALEITIVLTPGASVSVTGSDANNTVFALNQELQKADEHRLPIIRWDAK